MLNYVILIVVAGVFAAMNRARGSQFYDLLGSTTEGRLLSTLVMALTAVLPVTGIGHIAHALEMVSAAWLLLYLWTVPGWDAYWGAAIGSGSTHSKLWGVGMMTLRMTTLLPYYALLAYLAGDWWRMAYGASFLLMGAVYAFWGAVTPGANVIRNPELTNGAIMGITTRLILWI